MKRVIADALTAGYTLDVHDGEEVTIKDSTDAAAIFSAMRTTDEDFLRFNRGGKSAGWVFFVYGNEGWDVVNDYTTNLESVMEGANALASELA